MRAAVVIARKDLRQRLRDRSAIVLGLVAPIGIAALMSAAFGGTQSFHFTMGVVDADHGPVARGLVQTLDSPALRSIVTTRPYADEAQAAAAVRAGTVGAALVVPAGFSDAVASGHPRPLVTVTSVNDQISGGITSAVASSFVAQLNADRLSVAVALASGDPSSRRAQLTSLAGHLTIPLQVVARPLGARPLSPISYYSPGMAIFFLLFTIGFTARGFFADRQEGMIERMRAAGVAPAEIVAGKALSVLVYGVASLGAIGVVTSVAFHAHWGNPAAAALLGLVLVVAVVCITALVIGLARTPRQAEGISSMVTFGLALLGGNFIFLSTAPAFMRRLALFTPNGWAMRGFTDMATVGGGMGAVWVPVLAILAFSAVTGAVAATLAPRTLEAQR